MPFSSPSLNPLTGVESRTRNIFHRKGSSISKLLYINPHRIPAHSFYSGESRV